MSSLQSSCDFELVVFFLVYQISYSTYPHSVKVCLQNMSYRPIFFVHVMYVRSQMYVARARHPCTLNPFKVYVVHLRTVLLLYLMSWQLMALVKSSYYICIQILRNFSLIDCLIWRVFWPGIYKNFKAYWITKLVGSIWGKRKNTYSKV